jgi:hypothetical protein
LGADVRAAAVDRDFGMEALMKAPLFLFFGILNCLFMWDSSVKAGTIGNPNWSYLILMIANLFGGVLSLWLFLAYLKRDLNK